MEAIEEMGRLEQLINGGIELTVQGLGQGRVLEHSTVFASWCLSPDAAGRIKERRIEGKTLKLLIITWPIGRANSLSEQRQLVDISDPMAAITFNAGGSNRVVALIVCGNSEEELQDRYLSRRNWYYGTSVITADECGIIMSYWVCPVTGCIDVELPQALFAKKPWDWKWVNRWYELPPRDECAFRWRRAVAYTVQPPLVAAYYFFLYLGNALVFVFVGVVILLLLSIGKRNINYEPLRDPSNARIGEITENLGPSVFIPRTSKGSPILLPLVLSPLVLVLAGLLALIPNLESFDVGSWLIDFAWIMVIPIVSLGIGSVIALWGDYANWNETEQLKKEDKRQRELEAIDQLVCSPASRRTADVWQLPLRPKTVRFYLAAAKQKVCKSFAA